MAHHTNFGLPNINFSTTQGDRIDYSYRFTVPQFCYLALCFVLFVTSSESCFLVVPISSAVLFLEMQYERNVSFLVIQIQRDPVIWQCFVSDT